MTIFFTADLHLGHRNVLEFANRPFDGIEQMNDTLIENINKRVKKPDTLYILGDFAYRCPKSTAISFRDHIRCKNVHLVIGNHDRTYPDGVFQTITHSSELKVDGKKLTLIHYPMLKWNGSRYDWGYNLHGHIHSTGLYNTDNIKQGIRRYDVGVDANEYKPISLEEIFAMFDQQQK